jgi:parallel beta-helix repeat protein
MKTSLRLRFGAQVCAFFFASTMSIFAQGGLTPPGAPAPTMKTLDQIEPRMPLAGGTTPIIVSQSGSYYLTGNVSITAGSSSNGINIYVSNVTIDLNGFELAGSGATSGVGVVIAGGESNVTIRNGTIRNWGSHGINGSGNSKVRTENLRVLNNGGNGILADVNAEVVNCVAESNVGVGIKVLDNSIVKDSQAVATTGTNAVGISVGATGVITGCIARGNSADGIFTGDSCTVTASTSVSNLNGFNITNHCTIIGCTAVSNSNVGIFPSDNCTIKDCTATLNVVGINAASSNGSLIANCVASQNKGDGIRVLSHCLIISNDVSANTNGGAGVNTIGTQNRIDSNHCIGNASYGIRSSGATADYIMRNTCFGNGGAVSGTATANYSPKSGIFFGALSNLNDAGVSPWANF